MATKPRKGKKVKKGKGMGKRPSSDGGGAYDVAKAMIKSEKRYEEIMSASTKALYSDDDYSGNVGFITTEYIVTAPCTPGATLAKKESGGSLAAASDWIPVAQICVVRTVASEEAVDGMHPSVRAAVSHYRRENNYAATLAAPALKFLPREILQYGVEPLDSFVKYVYEDVVEGKAAESFSNGDGSGEKVDMTKSKAREILGLEVACRDASVIKQAYKKQSMMSHPDRFVNSDKTKEEIDETSQRFALVKMAYEALNSGVRSGDVGGNGASSHSWYEALGGKSRTEFAGPLEPLSGGEGPRDGAIGSAVVGLDPELTMSLVARNQAAAR